MSYKQRIVKKVKELREEGGSIGAFIRSEGLYYSAVQKWEKALSKEKARSSSEKDSLKVQNDELKKKVARLEKELAKAGKQLEKAEMIIDIQKKISVLAEDQQEK